MSLARKHELLVKFFQENPFSFEDENNELLINASEEKLRSLLEESGNMDFDSTFAKTTKDETYRLADGNTLFDISIFDSKTRFSQTLKALEASKNYLIFDNQSKGFLSWIDSNTLKSENWSEDDFFYSNIFSFKSYIKKWTEIGKESNSSEDEYAFIDYYNSQKGTFLLTTFTQKIQLKSPYYFQNSDKDDSGMFELFDSCFSFDSKHQFPRFVKKNLIDFVSKSAIEERLAHSFLKFDRIYDKANLDFQVY